MPSPKNTSESRKVKIGANFMIIKNSDKSVIFLAVYSNLPKILQIIITTIVRIILSIGSSLTFIDDPEKRKITNAIIAANRLIRPDKITGCLLSTDIVLDRKSYITKHAIAISENVNQFILLNF
jgi:hypothetical protein